MDPWALPDPIVPPESADDATVDPAELVRFVSTATELALVLERFIELAETLYPKLKVRVRRPPPVDPQA